MKRTSNGDWENTRLPKVVSPCTLASEARKTDQRVLFKTHRVCSFDGNPGPRALSLFWGGSDTKEFRQGKYLSVVSGIVYKQIDSDGNAIVPGRYQPANVRVSSVPAAGLTPFSAGISAKPSKRYNQRLKSLRKYVRGF